MIIVIGLCLQYLDVWIEWDYVIFYVCMYMIVVYVTINLGWFF